MRLFPSGFALVVRSVNQPVPNQEKGRKGALTLSFFLYFRAHGFDVNTPVLGDVLRGRVADHVQLLEPV